MITWSLWGHQIYYTLHMLAYIYIYTLPYTLFNLLAHVGWVALFFSVYFSRSYISPLSFSRKDFLPLSPFPPCWGYQIFDVSFLINTIFKKGFQFLFQNIFDLASNFDDENKTQKIHFQNSFFEINIISQLVLIFYFYNLVLLISWETMGYSERMATQTTDTWSFCYAPNDVQTYEKLCVLFLIWNR